MVFSLYRHADDGIFDDFPKISDHFPKIFQDSPKFVRKWHEHCQTFFENVQRLLKNTEVLRKTRRSFDHAPTNIYKYNLIYKLDIREIIDIFTSEDM